MDICIDIDGTITAGREMQVFACVCNERLKLGIAEERLSTLGYYELLAQPELIAYRQRVGEAWFKDEWGWIDLDPRVLVSLAPAPGAVEAIRTFIEFGAVTYCTARYVADLPIESAAMEQATRQWLENQQFPCSKEVAFCEGPKGKLTLLLKQLQEKTRQFVLIDDRYARLLEVLNELDQHEQDILRHHVTLVAYGTDTLPKECSGIRVLLLPSWQHFDSLFVSLGKVCIQKKEEEHEAHQQEITGDTPSRATETTARNTATRSAQTATGNTQAGE